LWTDFYSGRTFYITTAQAADASLVRVKSYADVFEEYQTHPEPKSAASNGFPCSPATRGLLGRRHVHAASICYIGKESNRLDEVEENLVHNWDEVREVYFDPKHDPWRARVLPILKLFPRAEVARIAGIQDRQVRRLLSGLYNPSPKTRARLTREAAEYARARPGSAPPADDLDACAAFLDSIKAKDDPCDLYVQPCLRLLPRAEIRKISGISERQFRRIRDNLCTPLPKTRDVLTRAAADYARARLGPSAPADDIAACRAFLEATRGLPPPASHDDGLRSAQNGDGPGSNAALATNQLQSGHERTCGAPLSPNPSTG
jgi:hypothetical protein